MSLKERILECIPTDKDIHSVSYEQVVCKRGTKMEKKLTW